MLPNAWLPGYPSATYNVIFTAGYRAHPPNRVCVAYAYSIFEELAEATNLGPVYRVPGRAGKTRFLKESV